MLGIAFFRKETNRVLEEARRKEAAQTQAKVEQLLYASPISGFTGASLEAVFNTQLELPVSVWKVEVLNSEGDVLVSARRPSLASMPKNESNLRTWTSALNVKLCRICQPGENIASLRIVGTALTWESQLVELLHQMWASALIFCLVFVLVLSLALRLSVAWPLRRLASLMRRAEKGDFLVRANSERSDEIGVLAQSFNTMLAAITSMKAVEIETHRDLQEAQAKLALQQALEATNTQLQIRLRELSTLFDVAKHLTSTLSLQELLDRITHLVTGRLEIPEFSIMLLNSVGRLEIRSQVPPSPHALQDGFEIGEGVCGQAAQTLQYCYVSDAESSETLYSVRPGRRSAGSLLSIPMTHAGTLLGVLNFERPEKASFSIEDINFLTAVADQAALAVMNAQLHEQTVELSLTDPLTGVHNRRHLFSQLDLEIARAQRFGQPLSMLMIDIDHFKKLNDASGHRAGDLVLCATAAILRNHVRKVDTVARYGGEEFVILLPQVTKQEAVDVAEKLRSMVEKTPSPYAQSQPGGIISISVGVSNFPQDARDRDFLVDAADASLYASKRGGRNRVTGYGAGMELHPGRERGPHAAKRARTTEIPVLDASS